MLDNSGVLPHVIQHNEQGDQVLVFGLTPRSPKAAVPFKTRLPALGNLRTEDGHDDSHPLFVVKEWLHSDGDEVLEDGETAVVYVILKRGHINPRVSFTLHFGTKEMHPLYVFVKGDDEVTGYTKDSFSVKLGWSDEPVTRL
jgi:hypothetical protein